MQFVVQLVIAVASWLAIMFVSINLIGIWVGGITKNSKLEEIAASNQVLTSEVRKSQRMQLVFATTLIISFLGILYYFWNVGLVIAALMLMVSRVPDVIWEIKTGKALALEDMKKPKFFLLATLLSWASMPVVWYSIAKL